MSRVAIILQNSLYFVNTKTRHLDKHNSLWLTICTMQQHHLSHIQKNKHILEARSHIIRTIREFFWNKGFQEVETPILLRVPGQEPYLSPMKLDINDDKGKKHNAYLHTSPEYTMKKMLAADFGNIFSICKTFRDYESFGGTHNPEFTMLEWYRVGGTMYDLMDDVEQLFNVLQTKMEKIEIGNWKLETLQRHSMKDVWQATVDVNLDNYLTQPNMLELCKKRGYKVQDDESYEDLFYRIFLNEIEPKFLILNSVPPPDGIPTNGGAFIIHHYPAPMAALAKLSDELSGYAERFEVYINGIEIANAFTELTDADEQLKRLREEQALRKKLGKDVYDIDMDFVKAIGEMPECAGIALGVDRLVQVLLGVENIDDVLVLPMSKMY